MSRNRFGSKPIHLFVFTRQHLVLRYCSADRDLVIGGLTYKTAQIERSEIKQTIERAKDKITIKCAYVLDHAASEYPVTQELGDNWFPVVPTDPVTVTCLAYDANSTDAPRVEWIGQVTQPKFDGVELELTCEPDDGYANARNQGARWQRGCWKTVYSTGRRGCNLGGLGGAVSATVTKIESVKGDAPPQAHLLVPGFGAYLQSLKGRTANWNAPDGPRSSLVLGAYQAYDKRTVYSIPGSNVDKTVFYWDDVGSKHDRIYYPGPWPVYEYITRYPALVLADATGLVVGSTMTIEVPSIGVTGLLTAVNGLQVTAIEFAESSFALAGGYITFLTGGLLIRCEVASHALGSDTLMLAAGGAVPIVGDSVVALPTCPRTWAACVARFNTANYGGSVYKPVKSPLDGVSMSWG